jgi:rhodanese-related sulfurtransferase
VRIDNAMMEELDNDWVDILTGHASARFKWVDVRSDEAWRKKPSGAHEHIPLHELPTRAREALSRKTELVVFGVDDAETAEAQRILGSLGFRRVIAFSGGFETLCAHLPFLRNVI